MLMVPSHGHYGGKTHFLGATRKLGPTPLHTSIQIQFQWNGTHAIPPYLDIVKGGMTMPPF